MNDARNERNRQPTVQQRKSMLIAQGALYRLGVSEAKNAVRSNLQMDALAKGAIDHLVANASGMFGNLLSLKSFRNGNVQTLLPLLITGISFLSKRRFLLKPVIAGVATLAAAGTLVSFLSRRRNRTQSAIAAADKAEQRKPFDAAPPPARYR